jgi:hypothetical protein
MRYSRSIGRNPVLLRVLASLDYQASFRLFVDCVKVFGASDDSIIILTCGGTASTFTRENAPRLNT